MNLTNRHIKVHTNTTGEIDQIEFEGTPILHDGKTAWSKIYPMIWPNINQSKAFVVDGKNYPLPKHGFWKELAWSEIYEHDGLTLLATHLASERFPFSIDIHHQIQLDESTVTIKTTFANLSHTTSAYFHFGHHPAFKIDAASTLKVAPACLPSQISLSGRLVTDKVKLIPFQAMDFGKAYDTLVFKNVPRHSFSFVNHAGIEVTIQSDGFNSCQVWKPALADFICIEPWQGANDAEYDAPSEAKLKTDIIEVKPGQSVVKQIKLSFKRLSKS